MYHMVLSHSFNMNQFIIPLFKILGISEKIRDEVYDADLIPKGPVFSSNSIALVPKPEDIRRKSYQPISTAVGLINANGGLRGYSTTGTGTGTPGNTVPLDFAAYAIQERGRKDSRRTSEGSQQYALTSSISPGGYSLMNNIHCIKKTQQVLYVPYLRSGFMTVTAVEGLGPRARFLFLSIVILAICSSPTLLLSLIKPLGRS